MSLALFDRAIAQEGYLYELARGVIEVSDVPSLLHGLVLQGVRNQFTRYQLDTEDRIHYIGGGSEAKLLVEATESERHPDLCIYLSPAPELDQPWSIWRPEIVVEVVSPSS